MIAPGLADPVLDAQAAFRAAMNALARPGTLQALPTNLSPPEPVTPELAAVALTLADGDAPLWLDAPLAAIPAVSAFLRFHTGAPIVAEPRDAAFALVSDPARLPAFDRFAPGTPEYPDRSATLVLAVRRLWGGGDLLLTGPGIAGAARLGFEPRPPDLVSRWSANRALFPLGVDLLLVAPGLVAGLPRTTRMELA